MKNAFQLFGTVHWAAIAGCVIIAFFLYLYVKKEKHRPHRYRDVAIFTIVFILIEMALVGSKIAAGEWTIKYNLPFHLCDISAFTILIALYTRSQTAFELSWYWGLVGGLMAILVPNIQFVDWYFVPFFIWHLFLILAPIYQLKTDSLRLSYKSIYKTLAITVLLGGILFLINNALGSNYMFVNEKISSFEALGLPDFPYYLTYLFVLAATMFHLVWGIYIWMTKSNQV